MATINNYPDTRESVKERINEDGELERQCTKCKEWWYADNEFFHKNGKYGLQTQCKACVSIDRRKRYKLSKQKLAIS